MNKYIPSPKIYKKSVSEIAIMTGLTAADIGNGLLLFCHWQKPNEKDKYIAISVIENGEQYYDLYEVPYDIEYENTCDSYGVPNNGPALLLNVEQHWVLGYCCFNVSKSIHSQNRIFPNIKEP